MAGVGLRAANTASLAGSIETGEHLDRSAISGGMRCSPRPVQTRPKLGNGFPVMHELILFAVEIPWSTATSGSFDGPEDWAARVARTGRRSNEK